MNNNSNEDKKNNNSDKKKLSKPLQLILLCLLGVVLILVSVIIKHSHPDYIILLDLLTAIGQSLIIGPALSWILDLPSMIDYFKKITVESLISSEYLQSLPRNRLVELRKECTAKIHLKDTDNVEKGLINLDENICELLTKPYFERFRQNTSCVKKNDKFVKTHVIDELLINPLNTKIAYDDFPKTYLNIPEGESLENFYKILSVTIKIDDQPEIDVTKDINVIAKKIDNSDIHFDTVVSWHDKNGKELSYDYINSIAITRKIQVVTPQTDIIFIKRVVRPVKSLKIDYGYKGNDLKLLGSCFGTLSFTRNGGY